MRMSANTYNKMNVLLGKCFNANAVIDNLAYNLDFYYYNNIAKVVHQNVAHVMPEWADLISDKMLELSARPVRKDINGHEQDLRDLKVIFSILRDTLFEIRGFTRDIIESADIDGDDEIRIFGENFLEIMSPFIKQAEEWINTCEIVSPSDFNIHIKEYTHFIPVN